MSLKPYRRPTLRDKIEAEAEKVSEVSKNIKVKNKENKERRTLKRKSGRRNP